MEVKALLLDMDGTILGTEEVWNKSIIYANDHFGVNVPKDFYIKNVNYIGNLQLLEAVPNIEKKDKDFDVWLKSTYTDLKQREDYMQKHHIPDIDLSFGNFEQFFMEREKLIVQALESKLI